MTLTFLGAAHEVTGSCTLLEVGKIRLLIDCGMEQGADTYENAELPVSPSELDAVLLTHAHIDHAGKIPYLTANGYQGPIFATYATERLCRMMLLDSAHIQESEAQWRSRKSQRAGGKPYEPLYTAEDVTRAMGQFRSCDYGQPQNIAVGVTARFLDAGHLLGSSSIELTVTEEGETKTLLFSGDIGNTARPLIRDPQSPKTADVVVIESTYGDRLHGPRPDYVTQLTRILQETFDRGGNVVIPSFAVGRTQELLYLLRHIKEDGLIWGHASFPVFVDSPMAVEATNIYSDESMTPYYDPETLELLHQGINPIRFPGLRLSVTSEDSKLINDDKTPKVILSASGMCEAGRIRHHLKHNLWREDSTILFVGYQSEGTLGRRLLEGETSVRLFGEEIAVRAHLEQLEGISGHADRDQLLGWLSALQQPPQQVFVNHGDDEVCDAFANTIKEQLHFSAVAPYNGAVYDLQSGVCLSEGNRQRMRKDSKDSAKTQRTNAVYGRLQQAGRRLTALIERSRGATNKDLAKMADQINELISRFER